MILFIIHVINKSWHIKKKKYNTLEYEILNLLLTTQWNIAINKSINL